MVSTQPEIKQEFELRLKKLEEIMEQRRQEQEAQRENHRQTAGNVGGHRGDLDMESPFLTIYEGEMDVERELAELEAVNADDFVIEENVTYAAALIKDFFKNKKILLDEEEIEEDEDCFALRAVEVHDGKDSISVKYENSFEVDGQEFTESVEVNVRFGLAKEDRLTVQVEHVSGDRLYFKKVAKELKNLFAYCLK